MNVCSCSQRRSFCSAAASVLQGGSVRGGRVAALSLRRRHGPHRRVQSRACLPCQATPAFTNVKLPVTTRKTNWIEDGRPLLPQFRQLQAKSPLSSLSIRSCVHSNADQKRSFVSDENNKSKPETEELVVTPLNEATDEDLELVKSVSDSNSSDNVEGDNVHDPFANIPGAEKGGRKLAIVYTCKVCNTRSAQKFTQQAYEHGVVLCRCPGCDNLHLIADRLGFFEDKSDGGWDIETFLKQKGESITTVTHDTVLEILEKQKDTYVS